MNESQHVSRVFGVKGSTPAVNNAVTAAEWLLLAALCRGLTPVTLSGSSGFAPASIRIEMTSACPSTAAHHLDVQIILAIGAKYT
jgi:hypothetical protein